MEPKLKSILTEYTELSAFSASAKECDHHLIFGSGSRKLADQEDGVIFGGRLGEYKYYDMDAVTAAALEAAKKYIQ